MDAASDRKYSKRRRIRSRMGEQPTQSGVSYPSVFCSGRFTEPARALFSGQASAKNIQLLRAFSVIQRRARSNASRPSAAVASNTLPAKVSEGVFIDRPIARKIVPKPNSLGD